MQFVTDEPSFVQFKGMLTRVGPAVDYPSGLQDKICVKKSAPIAADFAFLVLILFCRPDPTRVIVPSKKLNKTVHTPLSTYLCSSAAVAGGLPSFFPLLPFR